MVLCVMFGLLHVRQSGQFEDVPFVFREILIRILSSKCVFTLKPIIE